MTTNTQADAGKTTMAFKKKLSDLFNTAGIIDLMECGESEFCEIEFTDKPDDNPDTLIVASTLGKSHHFDENQVVEVDQYGSCIATTLDNKKVVFNFSKRLPIQETDFPDANGLLLKTVPIKGMHFRGNGLIPFQVTGRVIGDDEDVSYLILADDFGEAQETFCTLVLEEAMESMDAKSVLITESLRLD